MKSKLIFSICLALLILMSLAYAQVPFPYTLHVSTERQGIGFPGVEVTVTLDEGTRYESKSVSFTNSFGEVAFPLDSRDIRSGVPIKVSVCEDDNICSQTKFVGTGCELGGGCKFDFELEDKPVRYVCNDKSLTNDPTLCPEYVPPKEDKDDGKDIVPDDITEEEGLSDSVFFFLVGVLGTVLAALGVAWAKGYLGLAKFQWKKGNKK